MLAPPALAVAGFYWNRLVGIDAVAGEIVSVERIVQFQGRWEGVHWEAVVALGDGTERTVNMAYLPATAERVCLAVYTYRLGNRRTLVLGSLDTMMAAGRRCVVSDAMRRHAECGR